MKTKTKVIIFSVSLSLLLGAALLSPSVAYALPFGNESLGPEGQLAAAPPSYVPEKKIVIPTGATEKELMSTPEDMCIDNETGKIYIADTGNARILELSIDDESYYQEVTSYTFNAETIQLKKPSGLAVNSSYLYVADKDLQKLLVFNKSTLEFVKEINKPDSVLVGSTTRFAPTKVKVDDAGNVYTVLEGLSKGVMQLDGDGNFISYIGANRATTTLLQRLQSFFGVTSNDYMLNSADSVTNISLDSKGLLYTITNGSGQAIKKLNTTGNAIMSMNYNDASTVGLFVNDDGNIFSVQSNGYVTIYDSYGSLLFRFGGKSTEEMLGALKSPIAAAVYQDNELLVLDKEMGIIVSYTPTYFASLTYKAVSYYKEGLYLEGEEYWNEILKYNSKFILAYKALAKASMKKQNYDLALKQFRMAEDKQGYSDALWQIRDRWIRKNLGWVLLPILILVLLYIAFKLVERFKAPVLEKPKAVAQKVKGAPVVKDLGLMFTFMRHPRETVYEIKFKKRASLIGAIVLYVLFVAIQILKIYLTGYLFNTTKAADGLKTSLLTTLPLLLLVVCNYYVSSVRDGEGKLKDIFISFIYALSPYIVLSLPLFLISNIVTYNEQAIYFLVVGLVYAWCGINIVLTIMELHDYSLWKAIINILLTLVCFILIIAFVFILYVLGYQLFQFLGSVIKEALIR